MRYRSIAAGFIALVVWATSSPAFGFGEEGHNIVAEIAQKHLSVDAKRKLRTILGTDDIASRRIPVWADDIKPSRRDTAPFHYINIHIDNPKFDRRRDIPEGGCVVTAIEQFTSVLRDTTASKEERAEAAKFLVHLVGDIHQPLHCGDRNDKGGNGKNVKLAGRRSTLHSAWDTTLVREAMKDLNVEDFATALDDSITREEIAAWGQSPIDEWVNESLKIARERGYDGVNQNTGTQNLPDEYADRAVPELKTQFKRAGIRLAALLNATLAEGADLDRVRETPLVNRELLRAAEPRPEVTRRTPAADNTARAPVEPKAATDLPFAAGTNVRITTAEKAYVGVLVAQRGQYLQFQEQGAGVVAIPNARILEIRPVKAE